MSPKRRAKASQAHRELAGPWRRSHGLVSCPYLTEPSSSGRSSGILIPDAAGQAAAEAGAATIGEVVEVGADGPPGVWYTTLRMSLMHKCVPGARQHWRTTLVSPKPGAKASQVHRELAGPWRRSHGLFLCPYPGRYCRV